MRIISGYLKGRRLCTFKGSSIRPTSDARREALFNIIGSDVKQKIVLDLFAGTGALGLEALSRGASSIVFIDNSKNALGLIKKNINLCGVKEQVNIIKWDITKNLNCLKHLIFDLIFIDPPYNKNLIEPSLINLHNASCLNADAFIIIEHSKTEPLPQNDHFCLFDERKYGKTKLSFLKCCIKEKI